jgi:hypothetical protein
MKYTSFMLILFLEFSRVPLCFGSFYPGLNNDSPQDTVKDIQIFNNGRDWQNQFYMVKGDQFLFAKDFLPGEVVIKGRKFSNVLLKYDIYKDEILTPNVFGGILQMNKERVDSFSFTFQNKIYHFAHIADSNRNGFANILYKNKCTLYIRYSKYIKKLAVDGMYDKFIQESQLYFVKDKKVFPLNGKSDMMNILAEDKDLIKKFIKKNRLSISKYYPLSFIPVIQYFESLK